MAKIQSCNTPDLSIHLDSVRSFLPGERITGYVSRSSPWISEEPNISIVLHGRCNTEFFYLHSSLCRSSLALFGQDGARKELYNGALHIQSSSLPGKKWLFEIDIPRHPDPRSLRSHPFGNASYLPLPYADQHALPPSFDLGTSSAAISRHGFASVEYYLEAIMMTLCASKPVIARMPIQIRCESSPFPITDFDMRLHSRQRYTITSHCLTPGMETTRISVGQKLANVLGFSKAPRLAFRLEITVASVLQKDSPYNIPLEIRAVPEYMDTSEYIVNTLKVIDIDEFTLNLRSTSSIMAFPAGTVGGATLVHENHFVTKTVLGVYMKPRRAEQPNNQQFHCEAQAKGCLMGAYPPPSSPLTLPISDNTTPLDLGQKLNLKLQHEQLQAHEAPTFVTYNIKQTYVLEWKMSLEVGGEIFRVKGKHPVLIMEKAEQDSES